MKNLLTAFLPALALLALGGCASTSGLATSEDDGVYYSSKDRTTAVASAAPAQEPRPSTNEAANPDYNGNTAGTSARQNSGSDEYYDNTYTYMRGVPSYGVTDYMPYSPYTSINYNSYAWGGGWGGNAWGFSPYGAFDPFYGSLYSPFYSPFGFSSGLSIGFGFGRPWGFGGFGGHGFGNAYGFGGFGGGFGGGFYDPFYCNSPFYGGFYGRSAYYGNNFGYGNRGFNNFNNNNNNNRYYGNDNVRGRTSRQRSDRASDGRYTSGVSAGTPVGGSTSSPRNGGRMRTSDQVQAPSPEVLATPNTIATERGRARSETTTTTPTTQPDRTEDSFNRPRRIDRTERPQYRNMEQPAADQAPLETSPGRERDRVVRDGRRERSADIVPPSDPNQSQEAVVQPQEGQRRRGGFYQNAPAQPRDNGGQANEQPTRRRTYEQPRQERTYEQPRQERSYEQPQRSYSPPSNTNSGSSSGGGSGGGGSRGGGNRGRD